MLSGCQSLRHLGLNLTESRIGAAGVEALGALHGLSALHTLVLRLRGVDSKQVASKALASLPSLPHLRALHLDLFNSQLHPQRGLEFRWGAQMQALVLDLGNNRLHDTAIQGLAALRLLPALRYLELTLRHNTISVGGAETLAQLQHCPQLMSLTLALMHNKLGDAGAVALAELRHCPVVTDLTLDVAMNKVGPAGAAALAQVLAAPHVVHLCLGLAYNKVGAGGLAVADAIHRSVVGIIQVDLRSNSIPADVEAALRNARSDVCPCLL
eukprot:GGOE01003152.1.p1 GENE.GGOE01003152.1~~GGOE01003152.1.p1  ORF type:complete len:269 (+),score=45.29 GGOE01003152.1:773-1579(+)